MAEATREQVPRPTPGGDPAYAYGGRSPSIPHDELIDIGRLLHVINQRRITVMLVATFALAMAVLYLLLAVPIFSATSVVELHTRRPRIVDEQGAYVTEDSPSASVVSDALNTQFYKLQGTTVRDAVAGRLRKNGADMPQIQGMTSAELDNFLMNVVEFERPRGTYLVNISIKSDSPDFAASLANTYATIAAEVVKESTRLASMDAVAWLQDQIDIYEKELLNNEAKLIGFGQKHNIEGLNSAKLTAEQSIVAINSDLVDYDTQGTILQDMVATLEEIQSSPDTAGVLPSSTPRAEIIQTRLKEYSDAQGRLDALLTDYTDKHPDVQDQVRTVEALKTELAAEVERAKATAKADLALVNAYVTSIEKSKQEQVDYADEVQQRINEYNTDVIPLQRALEASDSSYKGLLNRIEEARMSMDEDTSLLTVYEWAKIPTAPVWPKKAVIILVAMILGGSAGVGLALLSHALQDKVNSVYDVEIELEQNLLGIIPHVKGMHGTAEMARISKSDKFSIVSESLAGLRAVLMAQGHRGPGWGWTLLVAGVAPLEGKTSASCNLAITMARTFKRVLMIDGDMRRPRLHEVFDIPKPEQALMEVLLTEGADEKDFRNLIHETDVPHLSVALGHPVEGISPTEVLETGKFEQFLDWTRHTFDVIIIDSPPLGVISDALVFGRMVDDVILLCRYNRSRKGVLKHAIKDLVKNGCPLTGIVINDFRTDTAGHGYGYGGYHGYHFAAYKNYYDKTETKKSRT